MRLHIYVSICVCVYKGMYAGDFLDWVRRVCEYTLHVEGEAPDMGDGGTVAAGDGMLHGVVGEIRVCMLEGVYEGRTGEA